MESQSQQHGVYVHYNHNDACKDARWTAKESYQFMHSREWKRVAEFYLGLVNGQFSLINVIGNDKHFSTEISMKDYGDVVEAGEETKSASVPTKGRTGRWSRVTFKIVLSYHGGSFDGWQKQPGLNTVQGLVEKSLAGFVDEKKVQLLKEKSLPIEGHAVVAGRTDKGVTAFQQVCSFYTWRVDVKCREIMEAINNMAPHKLKVRSVSKMTREFHPNFSAKWRRYLYIFPLHNLDKNKKEPSNCHTSLCGHDGQIMREWEDYLEEDDEFVADGNELDSRKKPRSFSVSRVNELLQQLEGKSLSYRIFARDTKASRSIGPPTECLLYHARAVEARLPYSKEASEDGGLKVMCVELVANRFLRKMVRVLVATAIREAAAGSDCDALLRLMDATCRRATAPPAPPDGLCLVDVGYQEFQQEQCLIL